MTTNDPRVRFLELESQANQLVEKLEQLRSESESYQTASGHLEAVSERIQTVLDAMLAASQGITETIAGLKEIGTPEILAAQQLITSAVEGIGDSLVTSSSELRSAVDAANSTVNQLDARLSNVESQIEKLDELTRRPLWLRLLKFK